VTVLDSGRYMALSLVLLMSSLVFAVVASVNSVNCPDSSVESH